jgi:aminoglycoside phosphotransferase (APT) family kinase protein
MSRTDPPGLDLGRLRAHLDAHRPGLVAGELTADVVEGGRSNLTYVVGDGRARWVVRRPPLGHVLPTAHDMTREFRVISGLRDTAVPVPEALLLCEDADVVGAQFYVMSFVEGTPYRTADELTALGEARTRVIADALVDTLVDLHAVDPAAVGLGDFGRPEGFLERQLRRWKKQLDASRSRDLPGIEELHDRLAAAVPVSGKPSIIHGDYRLDNVLVDGGDKISAVLDWEMSTLGDPLTDLALLVAYAERDKVSLQFVSNASSAPGYPTTDQVVAR